MREYGRDLRVADFIRDEIADIIMRRVADPRVGMISINDVRVSKDLSYADIYFSSVQATSTADREELVEVLNKAAGFFRTQLASRHTMRTTPKPRFHFDDLSESGPKLEELIDRAVQSDRRQDQEV
ncbi:MAG: 30S ribosome-binding factor RbfA [Proteobacteria bacterium]|nr:30S ribosome-binding factor RbfA [Pseudomonadota bacterium]